MVLLEFILILFSIYNLKNLLITSMLLLADNIKSLFEENKILYKLLLKIIF